MADKTTRLISLHPKFAAAVDAFVGLILLWVFQYAHGGQGITLWALVRLVWWIALSEFMFYPSYEKRFHHWLSLAFFQLGIIGYLIFLPPDITYVLASVLFIILPFHSFWLVPEQENTLPVVARSYRRWRLMLGVAGTAGIWSGILALIAFQIVDSGRQIFLLAGAGVLATIFISAWWWYEYGLARTWRYWASVGLVALFLGELAYVAILLPWGFTIGGLLMAWIWYIVWLIIRFHLSVEGVNWRRQRKFLIINALILLVFLLFVIRWY